jgi:homoserine kinase type II
MAVYTRMTDDELGDFVARYDIGDIESCTGIAQGIENSNYMLRTGQGNFILTLYEKRVHEDDLPFYLGLMSHLAEKDFPCPVPLSDRDSQSFNSLAGRPAAIVSFLEGRVGDCDELTPARCAAIGAICARFHRDADGFHLSRPNDLTLADWRRLFDPLAGKADSLKPGFGEWIADELSFLETHWPAELPAGIVHADLFPDNAFFKGDTLTGVIDFYFACNDFLAWDIAICLNAWCFNPAGTFLAENAQALLTAYDDIRHLTAAERTALPVLARGAAIRFLLTRLHDWFHTPVDALAHRKAPLEFVPLIEFHRSVSDYTPYGVR